MALYRTAADGNRSNVRRTPSGVVIATLEQAAIVDWDGHEELGWKRITFHTWTSKKVQMNSGDIGELDVHEGSGTKATFSTSGEYTARTCITVSGWISGERITPVE